MACATQINLWVLIPALVVVEVLGDLFTAWMTRRYYTPWERMADWQRKRDEREAGPRDTPHG